MKEWKPNTYLWIYAVITVSAVILTILTFQDPSVVGNGNLKTVLICAMLFCLVLAMLGPPFIRRVHLWLCSLKNGGTNP